LGGSGLTGAGDADVAGGGGVSPTSAGTGGGASLPSTAGSEAIPARAAITIAATLPTLPHLIRLPAMTG
jgi:hypothetical protein